MIYQLLQLKIVPRSYLLINQYINFIENIKTSRQNRTRL